MRSGRQCTQGTCKGADLLMVRGDPSTANVAPEGSIPRNISLAAVLLVPTIEGGRPRSFDDVAVAAVRAAGAEGPA